MVPTWFLHFPVTKFLQGSWEVEQASNSPCGFSKHTDLQENSALRTYSLFLRSSGNGHMLNCSKGCFLHFKNMQLIRIVGSLWGSPGLGLWCISIWKPAPHLSQWKLLLALKAESMLWSSFWGKTVNLSTIRFPFSFKSNSNMTWSSTDTVGYQTAGNPINWQDIF